MRAGIHLVDTSGGPARLHVHGPVRRPVLALGHGAGGGVESADLQWATAIAVASGWQVVLVEQPWRVAGRAVAAPPSHLDRCWSEALAELDSPVAVTGGRSAGARVACRTAGTLGVRAVVLLAFALHPPGRPERSRAHEIEQAGVPCLAVQGTRDGFGTAAELSASCPQIRVVPVLDGDHSLRVPARSKSTGLDQARRDLCDFLEEVRGG